MKGGQGIEQEAVYSEADHRVISRAVKKTDAHDAKTPAQFPARNLLPEAGMKEALPAEIASGVQTPDKLVKLRTTLRDRNVWSKQSPEVGEREQHRWKIERTFAWLDNCRRQGANLNATSLQRN